MEQFVVIDDKRFNEDLLLDSDEGQSILREAKASNATHSCGCTWPDQGPKLSSWERNHRMHISRFPNDGPNHSPECKRYEDPDHQAGRTDHRSAASAITELDDGRFDVSLNLSLRRNVEGEKDRTSNLKGKEGHTGSRTPRRNTTLFGLLAFASDKSGLCEWNPKLDTPRSAHDMAKAIKIALSHGNYLGRSLGNQFIIPRLNNQREVEDQLRSIRAPAGQLAQSYLFAIGSLYDVRDNGTDDLQIKLENRSPAFGVGRRLWNSAIKHSMSRNICNALNEIAARQHRARVMVIGRIEVDAEGRARFVNISMLATSPEWLPVLSQYELDFVSHAVNLERWLKKPMVPIPCMSVFPDALLLDADRNDMVEVKGRVDPVYERGFEKKLKRYEDQYPMRLLLWDAASGAPIPPLPPKTR